MNSVLQVEPSSFFEWPQFSRDRREMGHLVLKLEGVLPHPSAFAWTSGYSCYTPARFNGRFEFIRWSTPWQPRPRFLPRMREIRLKHVLFPALALLFVFVLWHDERFIIVHS